MRRSKGAVRSSSVRVASTKIEPQLVVPLSFRDLPCPVVLHRNGTCYLESLLRYRSAKRVRWIDHSPSDGRNQSSLPYASIVPQSLGEEII